jgi:hypothetical protein
MKGNVVTAAKLFGLSLILSALILAFGINLAVALHRAQPAEPTASALKPSEPLDLSSLFPTVFARYSTGPNDRMAELLVESEPLRQGEVEKRRFWKLTNPSAQTYERVSGPIEP